jgi:hypothetical protein
MNLRLVFFIPILSWFPAARACAAEPMLVIFDEAVAPAHWSMVQAGGACEARLQERGDAVSEANALRWKWEKPEGAWAGWGTPIVHRRDYYNFTPFLDRTVLRFCVKGEGASGGIGVLLKDTKGRAAEWTLGEEGPGVEETPGGWLEYSLPLRRTEIEAAGVDVSEIAELVFSAPAESVAGNLLVDFVHVVEVPNLAVYAGVALSGAVGTASVPEAVGSAAVAADDVLLVDDFSRRKMENLLGGEWGAFSAGDQGDVYAYVTEVSPGEFALEAEGSLPNYGGDTWAGIYPAHSHRR